MSMALSSARVARASGCARALRGAGVAALAALLLAGCAGFAPPKPWEKGDLARPDMQFDPHPLEAKAREHIYQSKEGAAGGYGVGGGGCGCN
jgi:hypothetical protein